MTENIRKIMLEELSATQAKNPNFSMRAFAKKMGVAQSAVSEILSGKRDVTREYARRILAGLDRSPTEIDQIVEPHSGHVEPYHSLDIDTFHLISDWYYYAILSVAETDGFKSCPNWIANRLGISVNTVKKAIDRLVRLGLINYDKKKKILKVTGEQYEAVSSVATVALKKASRQNLDLAQKALDETDFEERDFTAITLCFDPKNMLEAKKFIKSFRRRFCKAMESREKKEVYKLSIQLFPLTRRR
jgi:uncharacterized protein (TIGR02147 family)